MLVRNFANAEDQISVNKSILMMMMKRNTFTGSAVKPFFSPLSSLNPPLLSDLKPLFLTVKFAERHVIEEAGVELRSVFLQVCHIRAPEPSHAYGSTTREWQDTLTQNATKPMFLYNQSTLSTSAQIWGD